MQNFVKNLLKPDKELQFGTSKCKTMIVTKVKPEQFQKPELKVDSWEATHAEDGSINEYFRGKVNIEEENSLIYLGFMLSKNGDNMKNIIHKHDKTIGTKKQLLKLMEPLGSYTFEGAFIYIHSLLRSTLLYEALQVYIRLPPGVNFGLSLKRPKTTQ